MRSGDQTYYFCSDRCHDRFVANPMRRTSMSEQIDPICGMTVEPETAAAKREYAGKTYYFCGPGCAKAFDLKPEAFADTTRSA
jgi:Cu+-exporting ATPase